MAAAFAEDNENKSSESSWEVERKPSDNVKPNSGVQGFNSPIEQNRPRKGSVPEPTTMEFESQEDDYQLEADKLRSDLEQLKRDRSPSIPEILKPPIGSKDLSMIEEGQDKEESRSASLYAKSPDMSQRFPRSGMSSADKKSQLRLNPINMMTGTGNDQQHDSVF